MAFCLHCTIYYFIASATSLPCPPPPGIRSRHYHYLEATENTRIWIEINQYGCCNSRSIDKHYMRTAIYRWCIQHSFLLFGPVHVSLFCVYIRITCVFVCIVYVTYTWLCRVQYYNKQYSPSFYMCVSCWKIFGTTRVLRICAHVFCLFTSNSTGLCNKYCVLYSYSYMDI